MAKVLITIGLILVAIGGVWLIFPKALNWFGRLPGDINIQNGNTRVFIPIISMLLVSVALTAIANLIAWLARIFR